ncbi:hypothetical protein ACQ86I_03250 [Prescottella equi]
MTAALVLSLAIVFVFDDKPLVVSFFLGVGGSVLVVLIGMIPSSRYRIGLAIYMLCRPNDPIRVSISYLFQIRSSGRYLLIRGTRFREQFQPVGGVYKVLHSGATQLRSSFGVLDDNLIPIDQSSDSDLRVRVPAKNILRFLAWFESAMGRECTPIREFHEELIASGILNQKDFPFPVVQFVRRHHEPRRYSDYAKSQELLIADIFQLLIDDAQVQLIEKAVEDHPDTLMWATAEQIERHGAIPGQPFTHNIALPAQWLL